MNWTTGNYSSFRFPNGKLYYRVICNWLSVNLLYFTQVCECSFVQNPIFFFFYQQPFIYIPLKLWQTPIQLLKVLASVQLVNIDMPQNICWSTNRHTIISALGKRKRVMNLWAHHAPIEQFLKNCHNYSQMQTLACRRNHVFFPLKKTFYRYWPNILLQNTSLCTWSAKLETPFIEIDAFVYSLIIK